MRFDTLIIFDSIGPIEMVEELDDMTHTLAGKLLWKILFVSCLLVTIGCQQQTNNTAATQAQSQSATTSKSVTEWTKNANIYKVNVRQFTPEGTFSAFAEHLPRLKKMGVDILWFMPIYPISETKRKGTLGSYYAVSDYKGVNPEFGTMADFDRLVAAIHAQGMYIVLDWVPNHTGWDHSWIQDHPDWYTKGKDGKITAPYDPETSKSKGWTDVAELNYDNAEMQTEMIKEKLFWIKEHDIDGYREVGTHDVPVAFWDKLTVALADVDKSLFMIADAEHAEHRNSGHFHMSYALGGHDLLNQIAKDEKSVADIDGWFEKDKKFQEGFSMHFTSNHDGRTWNGTVFDRMGEAHLTLAALAFSMDGMPLLYGGQEEPMKKPLELFEKDDIGFGTYAYADFYRRLLKLKHENQALWNGEYGGQLSKILDHPDVYVFKREKNGDTVIGIFNLSDKRQSITIPEDMKVSDVITGQQIDWRKDTALGLEPWQYYLLSS